MLIHLRYFLALVGLVSLIGTALSAEPPPPFASCLSDNAERSRAFFSSLSPGISWPAWSDLLDRRWSKDAVERRREFDETAVLNAVRLLERGSMPRSYRLDFEHYKPLASSASPAQREAYDTAAALYRRNDWAPSISAFDAIVADNASPYRAAAAYTAARATLKLGDVEGGVGRIARIVADPSLQEFHLAAYHLLGTMSYLAGNPQIIAARYAEIANQLLTPPEIVCHDAEAQRLFSEANAGLDWYLRLAFPNDHFDFHSGSHTTRAVLDRLAATDPLLDMIRVLAAPTPYIRPWDWTEGRRLFGMDAASRELRDGEALAFAESDAAALTAHARERWLATKNLLWGYALAQRTADLDDIALLNDMSSRLGSLPDTPAVRAALPAFQWQFIRHEIRILLMNDRLDDAIARLHAGLPQYVRDQMFRSYYLADGQAIIDGGIRSRLEKFDLPGARRWAAESTKALHGHAATELLPLLAENLDDPALKEPAGWLNALRVVVDLLPAESLVEIAKTGSNLSSDQRRAFLAAGWLRLYLLGNWSRTKALLPDLRHAFPELATDIDNIESAWFDETKRHLLVRMLLRAPGLTTRSLWSAGQTGYRAHSIFHVDTGNPSDGNWWCPLDVEQLKLTLMERFYAIPLNLQRVRLMTWGDYGYGGLYFTVKGQKRETLLQLADQIIAWHPLLKGVDFKELAALSKVDSGPRLLSEHVVQWADSSTVFSRWLGRDRLLPETLYLAVRSTRYGCRRAGGHGEYSRAAYVRLHGKFADSEWAKKTPYWFDKPGRWPAGG